MPHRRRSPRGSADRNPYAGADRRRWDGRSPRGSADRNIRGFPRVTVGHGRSPRGSADRNKSSCVTAPSVSRVAPRAGARIETACGVARGRAERSLPARERGSKQSSSVSIIQHRHVAPRAGARIETVVKHFISSPYATSLPARERGSKRR